jgi:hypothetical protein
MIRSGPRASSFPPHRRRGRVFISILFSVMFSLGLASMAWITMLPTLISTVVRVRTGYGVEFNRFSANPFTGKFQVQGLLVKNPPAWTETAFLQVRELRIDFDIMPLLRGRFVADDFFLDLAQLTVVRSEEGENNVMLFKAKLRPPKEKVPGDPDAPPPPPPENMGMVVRKATVRFDKLVYADYAGRRPRVRRFDVALKQDYRDIRGLESFVAPLGGAPLVIMSDLLARLFKDSPHLFHNQGVNENDPALADGGDPAAEGDAAEAGKKAPQAAPGAAPAAAPAAAAAPVAGAAAPVAPKADATADAKAEAKAQRDAQRAANKRNEETLRSFLQELEKKKP